MCTLSASDEAMRKARDYAKKCYSIMERQREQGVILKPGMIEWVRYESLPSFISAMTTCSKIKVEAHAGMTLSQC